jgi:peptide/nickel transport system permease protein
MALYAIKRLSGAAIVVVLVTGITWIMIHTLRPESFAFDERPVLEQFTDYMAGVFLHFRFGDEGALAPTIADQVRESVPQDLQLLLGGSLFALVTGISGGMYCAVRPRALSTRAIEAVAFAFLCAPVYVVGLLLILLFGQGIGTFVDLGPLMPAKYVPFSDDPLRWFGSMLFPWIVLGLPLAAFCLRMTAAVMRELFDEQYIHTARMKGISPRDIVRRHALPASVAPVLSLTSVSVPIVITNLVLVEQVFSIPGVFQNTAAAMDDGNFPALQAMVVVAAALVALGSLVLDVALAALDPRVRLSAQR